ncbi:MAG: HAD family hydrolase [Propioniciclava sp.]|uniref:HAD-IIB family hydrolase n=1 Tax=Propioniciclava sp. TaxID=2038686 RepID=UPI0039E3D15F
MTRRLLATDLDGTIVFDRAVPPAAKQALDRWRAAGNLLVISTGKSIFATDDVLRPSGLQFDYCVCYSGAVITDGAYAVVDASYIPVELVTDIHARLKDLPGVATYATTIDNDYLLSDNAEWVDPILSKFTPLAPEQFAEHRFIGIPMLITDDAERDRIEAMLRTDYAGRFEVHRNQTFLDIVPPGADKGAGLRRLLDGQFGGTAVELWTLGDSWNDIPMHENADHAVCFTYSPDEVKSVCESEVARAEDLIDRLLEETR